ncbi:TPA: DUF4044 domain-containing protein [Streptococcus suis]
MARRKKPNKKKYSTMDKLVKGTAVVMVIIMLFSVLFTLYLSLRDFF